MTESGIGVIPFTDSQDAAYQYLKLKTENNGILSAHNDPSLSISIDDFEDGDLSEYSGDTGNHSVVRARSWEDSYALYNGGITTVFSRLAA